MGCPVGSHSVLTDDFIKQGTDAQENALRRIRQTGILPALQPDCMLTLIMSNSEVPIIAHAAAIADALAKASWAEVYS
jgi:hypothetical protein